ncbi:hypothetical protein LTR12_008701 [Friedmanniomyces endolithicus]|nr:hypothetical protein LTR12_008701 [Friedmanniomyces endolithicus]
MGKHRKQRPTVNNDLDAVQEILGLRAPTTTTADLWPPVFVCIDFEAFEHDHSKITEIGVAILDTRDVTGIDPGVDGQHWVEQIKYAHFRPVQYAELRNKNFVHGCAESFNFGSTTWINLDDAKPILRRIFRDPSQLLQAGDLSMPLSGPMCDRVFVAHGVSNEIGYLKQLGFDMDQDAQVGLIIDTQRLAGGSKKGSIALYRLLLSLGVNPVNLHNAGNDAAYTLQAMVTMAFRESAAPGTVAADLLRHGGKLPRYQYNSSVAPQVWMGTAGPPYVEPPAPVYAWNSGLEDPTSVRIRAERRRRKRVARARAKADPKAAAAAAVAKKRRPWSFKPRRSAT